MSRGTETPAHEAPKPGAILRLIVYYLDLLRQFLRNTALNGLKYLAFKYLTVWEKLFFFGCFFVVCYGSLNFAVNIIEKWQLSPVLIIMNPEATLVTDDPFPSVTICNMNQASNRKVKNYHVNSSDYAMLQKICFQDLNYTAYAEASFHKKNDSFASLIVRSAQTCEEMIPRCQWGLEFIACTDLFREVLLDEGICCTFNVAHPFLLYKGEYLMARDFTTIDSQWIPVDWHPERGYPDDLPTRYYPRTTIGPGISNGFSILLNGDIADYYCSSTNGPGFKIQLHNAIDTPQIKETGLSIKLGSQANIRINSIKDEAKPSLRSVKPKERQCYFSDENPLKYFRYYTRRNCEYECESSFFFRRCSCIPYHLPMIVPNGTVCYIEHFDCVVEAEKDFTEPDKIKCKTECLSGCHDLSYMPDVFTTPLVKENIEGENVFLGNFSKEYIKENLALINIYFPLNYFRSSVKTPYMGITEYLSQTGGIMSLMMGFSVISLVECVYFFALKPLLHLWQRCFRKNIISIQQFSSSDKEAETVAKY